MKNFDELEKEKCIHRRCMSYLYDQVPARPGARQEGSSGNRFDRFQACIPSPNYCTALGQLLDIPLALPRHVSAIGRKVKHNSTSASGNKQRHCLGDMYSEEAKLHSAQRIGARPRLQVEVELCAILLRCCCMQRHATSRL
jgi:hypothetical protein